MKKRILINLSVKETIESDYKKHFTSTCLNEELNI